ncbi:MAG: GNAT family N-acetyltransferase [Armatimonadetes bacterium]|nr:GNAT family N-acetyltransferase [Armatimonadota bacterium]
MTILQTPRLLLATWYRADLDLLRPIATDPEVMRFIGTGELWNDERIVQFIERQMGHYNRFGYCMWKLIDRHNGRLIGLCGLQPLAETEMVEIGWWLATDCWGAGLATEATQAVLAFGFHRKRLPEIVAIAHPDNHASLKVMEKIGLSVSHHTNSDALGLAVSGVPLVLWRMSNPFLGENTSRLIDLSHTVEAGMITYRGLPAPIICDFLSREASRSFYTEGTEFQIGKLEMVANTGTYLDSPFHRYREGDDLADLELGLLADLDAAVVHHSPERGQRAIDASAFAGHDLAGKALLIHTNWAQHWRTDQYFEGHPFLTLDAAIYLRDAGVRLVGIDSYNIDSTDDMERPAHTILLGANIPIVEHMRGLEMLPDSHFRFYAVPAKVKGFGTFPVRAFAVV